jgi:iron complex transport system substrate-binding protein
VKYILIRKNLFIFVLSLLYLQCSGVKSSQDQNEIAACKRIVSFAPSITETLFALSLGDRVVGVTRYCNYPSQTSKIPKVGGFVDPNYEMLLRLHPDLVIVLKEHNALKSFLHENAIRFIEIDNSTISGILNSFVKISEACGEKNRGENLSNEIKRELYAGSSNKYSRTPRVLLCAGRESPGNGRLGKVFAAGKKTFYNELIKLAGGENVITDSLSAYPSLSGEGIIRLAPDIIIDMIATSRKIIPEKVANDWADLDIVKGVNKKNIYVLSGDYLTIPGPRVVGILNEFRAVIAKWDSTRGE